MSERGPGNIHDQNCCKLPQEKCGTNQIAPFVHVTKRHVGKWRIMDWARPSHERTSVVSVARLETSESQEHYSLIMDSSAALLKGLSKLSCVEVSYTQVCFMITYTASYSCLFKALYLQFSCCIIYCLIKLNPHGGSRSAVLWLRLHSFILNHHLSSPHSCDRRRTPQIDYVKSCNFMQLFMLPSPLPLIKEWRGLGTR